MTKKKNDPDVVALKRAVNALFSMSSERAMRAAVNYIYDTFISHPSKSTKEHFASRESVDDDGAKAAQVNR